MIWSTLNDEPDDEIAEFVAIDSQRHFRWKEIKIIAASPPKTRAPRRS